MMTPASATQQQTNASPEQDEPRPAGVTQRIIDVRFVLDRDDHVRVYVEGTRMNVPEYACMTILLLLSAAQP